MENETRLEKIVRLLRSALDAAEDELHAARYNRCVEEGLCTQCLGTGCSGERETCWACDEKGSGRTEEAK